MNRLFGISFFSDEISKLITQCNERFQRKKVTTIATANPEIMVYARNNPWYASLLKKTTFVTCDGYGTYLALKRKVPRITGVALVDALCAYAENHNRRIVIMGTISDSIIHKAISSLKRTYPNLQVEGTSDITVIVQKGAVTATGSAIENFFKDKPDIVFIALGHPKQEYVLQEYIKDAPFPCIAVGVGGAIDMLAKPTLRAPKILAKFGLEWVYRLLTQPILRIRRVFTAVILFPIYVLTSKTYD